MSELPTFGRRLAALRESRVWSQNDLARVLLQRRYDKLGVSPQYISGLENDESANPCLSTVLALCAALGCSAADLLDNTAERARAEEALRAAVEAEQAASRTKMRAARRDAIAECAGKLKKGKGQ